MKRITALIIAVLMLAVLLCSCGEKQDDASTPDEVKIAETTVVLETTADGGTVEQDPDGNKITKDKDGKVTAVEDKDGNPVDVATYLETHSWVEEPGAGTAGGTSSSPESGSSQSPDDSSDPQEDLTEGEIPVIIASIPDDADLIELPD